MSKNNYNPLDRYNHFADDAYYHADWATRKFGDVKIGTSFLLNNGTSAIKRGETYGVTKSGELVSVNIETIVTI